MKIAEKYNILNAGDFCKIALATNYQPNYVRQVLRGHTKETKFNIVILDEADKVLKDKIEKIQKG
jgi:hypothetical protein